jgi:hypothetical protein
MLYLSPVYNHKQSKYFNEKRQPGLVDFISCSFRFGNELQCFS